jgi:hypothetical protein
VTTRSRVAAPGSSVGWRRAPGGHVGIGAVRACSGAAEVTGRPNRLPRPDRPGTQLRLRAADVSAPGSVRSRVHPHSSTHGGRSAFARCRRASRAQRDVAWRPRSRGRCVDSCGTLPSASRSSTPAQRPRDVCDRTRTTTEKRRRSPRARPRYLAGVEPGNLFAAAGPLDTKRRSKAIRWSAPERTDFGASRSLLRGGRVTLSSRVHGGSRRDSRARYSIARHGHETDRCSARNLAAQNLPPTCRSRRLHD